MSDGEDLVEGCCLLTAVLFGLSILALFLMICTGVLHWLDSL